MSLSLFLLLACFGKDADDDDDDDGPPGPRDDTGDTWADGGTEGDGGTSGDGGASGDGGGDGGGASGPCPDYAGLGPEGSVRTYETTASYEASAGISGTYVLEVEYVGGDGTVRVAMESDYRDSAGGRSLTEATYWYTCDDDGAWLAGFEASGSYTGSSYSYTWTQDVNYTDPSLTMASGLSAGESWTDAWAYFYDSWTSTGGMVSDSVSGTTTTTFGSEATVTVPAGTYTVRRIDSSTTTSGSTSTTSWQGDRAVGMVKSEYYELVDYAE